MITFKDDLKKCVNSFSMSVGQTGVIAEGTSYQGIPIMKIHNEIIVALTDGNCTWECDPAFKVHLCDFELRVKE